MKMTRTLPTDKYGRVYYGPKTYADAVAAIRHETPTATVVHDLRDAGFKRIARRIERNF